MEFLMTRDTLAKTTLQGKQGLFAGLDCSLQMMYEHSELPGVLTQALRDGIPWQVRAEMTIERSVLSPGSTYPWVAMLVALGTEVLYPDGSQKNLSEYMKQRTNAAGHASGILIPLDLENFRICYQAVRPRPAALPTVSVCTVVEMDNDTVRSARIILSGTWKNKVAPVDCAEEMVGKRLDSALIDQTVNRVLTEIKPVTNFQASESYRREMAKVLTQRALTACMQQGEVTK